MNGSVLTIQRPDAATAILTLNRPQRRNALTMELMEALCQTLESLAAETQRRVVILRGAGPVFCAGLDLYEAAQADLAQQSARLVARTFQTLADSPLVTIAAVHGAAYAGGAGLMACCDFVAAAEDLRVCFPEVRRGLVPALAAAVVRPRLRDGGLRELLLLAEPVDAPRALRMGLVDRIVPGDQLMAVAQAIAAAFLKGGPHAVRQTKRLLRDFAGVDRGQLFARALEFHKQARFGAEAQEGLAAFAEHREPNWSNRLE
jgi:methylglutaconyl-CoA hydratase